MKRKYPGTGYGAIASIYVAIDNMTWLRKQQKRGQSISEIVNRAIVFLRTLEEARSDEAALVDTDER